MSYLASALYFLTWILMMSGFFFFKRKEEVSHATTWIGMTIYMSMMYNAFWAGVLTLVHIPINLYTFAVVDGITGVLLWMWNRKRGVLQKYKINGYDVLALVLLVLGTYRFMSVRYGGFALNWNYKTVDPSAHYREAMEYINNQAVSRMFFAQLNNGMFMQFFMPTIQYDYMYKAYVLADVANLLLSGVVFYGVIRKFAKNHFGEIAAVICTVLYTFGYPMNSTLYGFGYLEMGINIIMVTFVLMEVYVKDDAPKAYSLIALMLASFSIFQGYALFMPITYLAVGFSLLYKNYQDYRAEIGTGTSDKKIVGKKIFGITIRDGLSIFVLPIVLGMVFTYLDVFVKDNVSVGGAMSTNGAIYRDLYVNFMYMMPIVIVGLIKMLRTKENTLANFFIPLHILFTIGMLALGIYNRSVSSYYFYKNHYLLWFEVFYVVMYGISVFGKEMKQMTVAIFATWICIFSIFYFDIEHKLYNFDQTYVVAFKAEYLNDLYCFNINTTPEQIYPETRMELNHYAYQNLIATDETDKQVPVVAIQYETYLYESMTGQRLSDYDYWQMDGGVEQYYENIATQTDYVVVYTNNEMYEDNQEYFDSLERVFENDYGFVAKTH